MGLGGWGGEWLDECSVNGGVGEKLVSKRYPALLESIDRKSCNDVYLERDYGFTLYCGLSSVIYFPENSIYLKLLVIISQLRRPRISLMAEK